MESRSQVTQILGDWNRGSKDAADRLFPLVYDELKRIAARYFGHERSDHTLQPTALVHEAFLRLVDQTKVKWESRAHFMAVAATMMRRILVDYARAHEAQRRGGQWQRVVLEDSMISTDSTVIDYLALEKALGALTELDAAPGPDRGDALFRRHDRRRDRRSRRPFGANGQAILEFGESIFAARVDPRKIR